jgi:hypothetical protein
VSAVAVLLPTTGSAVVEDTEAVLVRKAACVGAATTTVMVGAVAPAARVATVHETETLPVLVQAQPAPAAEMNVTPAGSVSVTATFDASDGPWFTTTKAYERLPAASTVAGAVLVMARSADPVTPVVTEEVLLVGSGSLVVLDTLAVFVRLAAWSGAVTTRAIAGAVRPVANPGRVQLTEMLPVFVQVQPVPVAETKTTPAGSESDTVTGALSDGPWFTTDRE